MIVEIISVDNIAEVSETSMSVDVIEQQISVVEVDDQVLEITFKDEQSDMTLEIVENAIIVEENNEIVTIVEVGCDVINTGGTNNFFKVDFSYDDPNIITLLVMQNGECITQAEIFIEEPFNDPLAELSVGTPLNNELFFAVDDICPNVQGFGVSNGNNEGFDAPDLINLYLDPGSSTQGKGHVLLTRV